MKEARYFYVPEMPEAHELPPDEAAHALRVLRLQTDDEIFLIDGRGTFYKAAVTMATHKQCAFRVVETMPQERQWHAHLHLAVAPTKMMERMEWMAEKCTEVGFDELSFLDCRFSERRVLKTPRVEKIITAAVKQSRKAWMPKVNDIVTFRQFIDPPRKGLLCIAHCYDEIEKEDFQQLIRHTNHATLEQGITLLVGPEGDFSIDEVRDALAHGYHSVSFGTSRLRTETAALIAVAMMRYSEW